MKRFIACRKMWNSGTRDTAGNVTTANTSHTYGVDTVAPTASISIDNVTSDNVINASESGQT
ncbi:hypothetical protein, partial [Pectobacterium carotovorum]|uniref:hypothetical protein n=1 Tax=Pectobacterium carotovorum TaxID=554 RepID=UPI002115D80E